VESIRDACKEFIYLLSAGGLEAEIQPDLVERLGATFVSKGLWRDAPKPVLDSQFNKRRVVFSRIVSYGGFYHSILKRTSDSPPIDGLPSPLSVNCNGNTGNGKTEVVNSDVDYVRNFINRGLWRGCLLDEVRFDSSFVWLAPEAPLRRKLVGVSEEDLSHIHRDIIGLSHFRKGHHLIRIDFDFSKWPEGLSKIHRRPHGAGNGGNRFRLHYDGAERMHNWGRTVDLNKVEIGYKKSLNGVPELIMEGFSIPKSAITAEYLGVINRPPESNHVFFIDRLRRKDSLEKIISDLKEVLR